MLVACQKQVKDHQTEIKQDDQKEDLVLKEWKYMINYGDGNEDGYYRLINNDDGYFNILYTDYKSGQEVYLCDKPECQHKDDSCTSYIDSDIAEMFIYKDHLYMIENSADAVFSIGADGQSVEDTTKASKIYQLDLNGQNKKEIYQLKEGYSFENGNLFLDNNELYLAVKKSESVETKKNSITSMTTKSELYKINLETGKDEKVMDLYDGLSDKSIMAVEGRKMILCGNYYKKDLRKYLEKKDYEGYDQALMDSEVLYEVVDIDTLEKNMMKTSYDTIGEYHDNKIYYTDHNVIYAYDLTSQKEEKIYSLPKGYTYDLEIIKDKVIVYQWKEEQFEKSYSIDLQDKNLKELKQYKRKPKEAADILSVGSKNMLVVYDREGGYEKTWAGTMQYETKKQYRGLISIDDFFNNQKNYKEIKLIYEGG